MILHSWDVLSMLFLITVWLLRQVTLEEREKKNGEDEEERQSSGCKGKGFYSKGREWWFLAIVSLMDERRGNKSVKKKRDTKESRGRGEGGERGKGW
jgi:hypothetical protein